MTGSKLRAAAMALSQSPRGGIGAAFMGLVHVRRDLMEALDAALSAPEEPDARGALLYAMGCPARKATMWKP